MCESAQALRLLLLIQDVLLFRQGRPARPASVSIHSHTKKLAREGVPQLAWMFDQGTGTGGRRSALAKYQTCSLSFPVT